MVWPGSALKAWAEKQQSREDDRFALEKHRRPPPCRLTGLIGRHRRCVENRLARTGLPGLYYDKLCTQASLLHIQPPDDRSQHLHDRTKAQQINRRAPEPCLPRQSTPGRESPELAEQLLFSWRPPTPPSIVDG